MDKINYHLDISAAGSGKPADRSKKPSVKESVGADAKQTQNEESGEAVSGSGEEKDVTFLFYMNGQYPDMEQTLAAAVKNLESAGSSSQMNLIAQLGRAPQKEVRPYGGSDQIDNDWSGVRRYYIVNAEDNKVSEPSVEEFKNIAKKLPKNPLIHQLIGDVYARTGHRNLAHKEYKMAESLGYDKFIEAPESKEVKKWSQEFDKNLQPLRDADMPNFVYKSEAVVKQESSDMMKPTTLKDFVSWGMRKYPAKHYVLVMMGHGGAWSGTMKMSPAQIGDAINKGVDKANEATEREDKIDTLVFNSCYMGNLETVQEVSNAADITIASQMTARTSIFHQWAPILKNLQKDLDAGKEFDAEKFATDYVNYYKKMGKADSELSGAMRQSKESFLTLTAIDNKKVDMITAAWGRLVKDWEEMGVDNKEIFKHIEAAKDFGSNAYNNDHALNYSSLRDLGSIAINIMNDPKIPAEIKEDCRKIRSAMREAIIAEQHTGYGMEEATGLSVWAPLDPQEIKGNMKSYESSVPVFAEATGWGDKLESALKQVDKEMLGAITDIVRNLGMMSMMLETPGLTAKEKSGLKAKIEILKNEVNQMKKELTLAKPEE
jgi:hypothetical protein